MSIIVKGSEPKTVEIEDGLHKGVIQRVEKRQPDGKEYVYLDLYLALDEEEVELKVGYPMSKPEVGLNSKQSLGKLVQRITGESIKVDVDYNLEELLTGRKVQFVTLQNEKGYSDVTKESVKPIPFSVESKEVSSGVVE